MRFQIFQKCAEEFSNSISDTDMDIQVNFVWQNHMAVSIILV